MKDCIRSEKEARVKDTLQASDLSDKTRYASVTEMAESWVEGSLDIYSSKFIDFLARDQLM